MKQLNYGQSVDEEGLELMEAFEDEVYMALLNPKFVRKFRMQDSLGKPHRKKRYA